MMSKLHYIIYMTIQHAAHIFAIIKAHFTVLTLTRCIWELRVSQEFSSWAPARARVRRSVQGARGGLMMVAAAAPWLVFILAPRCRTPALLQTLQAAMLHTQHDSTAPLCIRCHALMEKYLYEPIFINLFSILYLY